MRHNLYNLAAVLLVLSSTLYTGFFYLAKDNDDKVNSNTDNNELGKWDKPKDLGKNRLSRRLSNMADPIGEPFYDGREYGWQFFSDKDHIHKRGKINCLTVKAEDGFYVQENLMGFDFHQLETFELNALKSFFESKIFDSKLLKQIKVNSSYNQKELITFGFEVPKNTLGFSIMDEILEKVEKSLFEAPKFIVSCLLVKPICDFKEFSLEFANTAHSIANYKNGMG